MFLNYYYQKCTASGATCVQLTPPSGALPFLSCVVSVKLCCSQTGSHTFQSNDKDNHTF